MTDVDKRTNEHDLETPDSIQVRFGISYIESRPAQAIAALTMPMERFRNPFTGAPTVGPLAILVDAAAGIVNHYDGTVIGAGTVRSFFIDADDVVPQYRSETLRRSDIDIVHGGVAAAGLELAASAAVNWNRADGLLQTASVRVNFLRPFLAGADSRYEGKPLRVGRSTAVGDAQALGDDGTVAITARVTAYR